ncbi:MAG: phosphonate C-P lyase system protein PhnG [Deltaproteobacteria bacterium]|nr:phosphonate C-P lyase system protein PhnG [Deltaproteobacteria bacterium]
MENFDRARRIRALCLGDKGLLANLLDSMGQIEEPRLLKGPEAGLLMVRGKVSGSGAAFNLGEALLTRCVLAIGDKVGYGFKLGLDPEGALLSAMGDALAQDPEKRGQMDSIALSLEEAINEGDALEREKALKTKVDFLTMTRGEDDD